MRQGNRVAIVTAAVMLLSSCSSGDSVTSVATPTAVVADVVDGTAVTRCDRLGYPCSFSDVEPEQFERLVDLTDRVEEAIASEARPEDGIAAAAALLADEDGVVELIPDDTLFASIMFRLEGTPPAVAFTELAGPVGEAPAVPEEPASPDQEQADGTMVAASFRPAGGPIEPKRALVLDPYAMPGEGCAPEAGDDCWITGKGRSEGAAVQAIMAAHPQIQVTYVNGLSEVDMAGLVGSLGGYDLIHIATHGSSNCNSSTVAWFTGIDETAYVDRDNKQALAEDLGGIKNQQWVPDECYSVAAIAPLDLPDQSTYESQQSRLPADLPEGLAFNNSHWLATTDFWAGRVRDDAIAYFSHCTSGDGQFAKSGDFGAFVGWHSYARLSTAQDAAISFWQDMVSEGVEFELAKQNLSEQQLDWTITAGAGNRDGELRAGASVAALVAAGQNLRARDVIKTRIEGSEVVDGSTIQAEGYVGDNEDDRIEEVTFLVEGVRNGTENDTRIEVRIDGEALKRQITVGQDGKPTDAGDLWTDWEVTVENLDLERDLTRQDTDPEDPEEHSWEARVFLNQSFYSAQQADPIDFAARVRARGKLARMDQLGSLPRSQLTTNELVFEFPSDGGDVEGGYFAQLVADNNALTAEWRVEFDGSYDAESGRLSGTGRAVTDISSPVPPLNLVNLDLGSFEGTVDHSSGRVDVQLFGGGEVLRESLRYS